MKKFIPQTVAAQLIALLLLVLIVGQGFSLWLIIGENRMQARAIKFKTILEATVEHAPHPSNIMHVKPPFALPDKPGVPGSFFFSRNNRAALMAGTKHLPKYEQQYGDMLRAAGYQPLSVLVVLQSGVLGMKEGVRPPPPLRNQRRGPDGPRFERPPRPLSQGGLQNRPRDRLQNHPPPRAKGNAPALGMQDLFLSAELAPGLWYNAMVPHYSLEAISSRILIATGVWILLTLLAVWFFARRITGPLSALTTAANRLGRGETAHPLTEQGPSDLRKAASAFNTMQTRLTRTLETQRTMLRAIGHDLRTPLTSLRIRAENIPDPKEKKKFIATLDDMTSMTEEILGWAKDVSGLEDYAVVDLNALLAAQADNYNDQGQPVSFDENGPVIFHIRRIALTRALQNLIDNAVKYGKTAHISIEKYSDRICIHVDDEGPGIPEDKLQDVRKPFVRLETSRSKETGGTGLGLSIADSIAQSAGGKLILKNRSPNGLRATLQLPSAVS